MNWQPTISGELIQLRPLAEEDFEALWAAAADPGIWEQHPERDRYRRENFARYFRSGMESGGALLVRDRLTGEIIGSSRFTAFDPERRCVEVGYTFLVRDRWGRGHNRELKRLMLGHAFQFVDVVRFVVGEANLRSRRAVEGIGAVEVARVPRTPRGEELVESVVYELTKAQWRAASRPAPAPLMHAE